MQNVPAAAAISIYALIVVLTVMFVLLWGWQVMVLRGKRMENPDDSADDWHEEKGHYGIALADVVLGAPAGVVGAALAFLGSRWGFYLFALVSFWYVWASTMTTATSLRFYEPRFSLMWFVVYPLQILLPLAYLILSFAYFDELYAR